MMIVRKRSPVQTAYYLSRQYPIKRWGLPAHTDIAVFRFIKYTWYFLLKELRFKTVLNQFAHRYNLASSTR